MNLILTGFGPFPNHADNPSGQIASSLGGFTLKVAYDEVDAFLDAHPADFYLCLGLNAKAKEPQIEIRAFNERSLDVPDVTGAKPKTAVLIPEEPESLTTSLEASMLYMSLICEGLPCGLSSDPGRYLCNYVYFKALSKTNGNALFVHLPPAEGDWPLDRQKRLVKAILRQLEESAF